MNPKDQRALGKENKNERHRKNNSVNRKDQRALGKEHKNERPKDNSINAKDQRALGKEKKKKEKIFFFWKKIPRRLNFFFS